MDNVKIETVQLALNNISNVDGAINIEGLKKEIKELEKLNVVTVLELGKRFILLKSLTKRGEWSEFINNEIELGQDAVNKYMKIAQNFTDSELVQALGIKKVYLLISVDKADRDEFLKVNDVIGMSYRELVQVVNEYKGIRGLIKPITIDADKTVKNINRLVCNISNQYTELLGIDNPTKEQKQVIKLCKSFIEGMGKLTEVNDTSNLADATN